jgi:hypothetical protein
MVSLDGLYNRSYNFNNSFMKKYETALSKAICQVPAGDVDDVIKKIASELFIEQGTVYAKIRGDRPVSGLQEKILKKLFFKIGINYETH